jgi:hypothetical protein
MSLESKQPKTETVMTKLSKGKVWQMRKAYNFTAISRLPGKCGSIDVTQSYGSPLPAKWINLYFFDIRKKTLETNATRSV